MDIFLKSSGAVLVALILGAMLTKQSKDTQLLLSVCVCAMVLVVAVQQFIPVINFFEKLQDIGQLDGNMIEILLKAVGIGFIGEITSTLCTDSGNAAMGKTVQLLSCCMILMISLPLFDTLLELIEDILKFI